MPFPFSGPSIYGSPRYKGMAGPVKAREVFTFTPGPPESHLEPNEIRCSQCRFPCNTVRDRICPNCKSTNYWSRIRSWL